MYRGTPKGGFTGSNYYGPRMDFMFSGTKEETLKKMASTTDGITAKGHLHWPSEVSYDVRPMCTYAEFRTSDIRSPTYMAHVPSRRR